MKTPYQKAIALAQHAQVEGLDGIEDALSQAMDHVARYAKGSQIEKIDLLLIGGASLHLAGFRESFSDIDLLIGNLELSSRMEPQLLQCKNSGMKVELFYDNRLGSLVDLKMFSRAMPFESRRINGIEVNVGIYPPEYFLLMKMEVGREKCQNDIRNMLQGIPLESLSAAFNELARFNEKWVMNDLADMLVTDLVMLYLPGKLQGESLGSLKQFVMDLNIEQEKKKELVTICKHLDVNERRNSKASKASKAQECPAP